MDLKEIARLMIYSFLIVLVGAMFAAYLTFWNFLGRPPAIWSFIDHWGEQILLVAFLTTPPRLLFYSKRELDNRGMLLRHAIHFPLIVVIVATASYFFVWFPFSGNLFGTAIIVASVTVIYAVVLAIDYLRSKRLAHRLTQEIEEWKQS